MQKSVDIILDDVMQKLRVMATYNYLSSKIVVVVETGMPLTETTQQICFS